MTTENVTCELEDDRWEIHAHRPQCGENSRKASDWAAIGEPPTDARSTPVVFGPYLELETGRYHVSFSGRMNGAATPARLVFEVASAFGDRRLAAVERVGEELSGFDVRMEFVHDRADGSIEFRIFAVEGDIRRQP